MTKSPQHSAAAAVPVFTAAKTSQRVFGANGHFQANVSIFRIPRCPSCSSANPGASDKCPNCGAPAPMTTDHQTHVEAVVIGGDLFPWHARLFLWIGGKLFQFAEWLNQERRS